MSALPPSLPKPLPPRKTSLQQSHLPSAVQHSTSVLSTVHSIELLPEIVELPEDGEERELQVCGPQEPERFPVIDHQRTYSRHTERMQRLSYGIWGVIDVLEERRSYRWQAKPWPVVYETDRLPTHHSVFIPPHPWEVEFGRYTPSPREVNVPRVLVTDVPHSNVYRTCYDCCGAGHTWCRRCVPRHGTPTKQPCATCKKHGAPCKDCKELDSCSDCSNTRMLTCALCKGQRALKLCIELTITWKRHVATTANAGPLPIDEEHLRSADAIYETSNVEQLLKPSATKATPSMLADLAHTYEDLAEQIGAEVRQGGGYVHAAGYYMKCVPLKHVSEVKARFLRRKSVKSWVEVGQQGKSTRVAVLDILTLSGAYAVILIRRRKRQQEQYERISSRINNV
ncbi:hypothetical protein RI367_007410 [Sorochytrium milnesiophthora]